MVKESFIPLELKSQLSFDSGENNNTINKGSNAELLVKEWMASLGNRDFKKAYELMTRKKGGDFGKFSSTKGYGGITKTNLISCTLDKEDGSSAEVIAEYEAFDPQNHNGKFCQRFILTKQNDKWLISEIKNIYHTLYN